jgi:hypothetical protein
VSVSTWLRKSPWWKTARPSPAAGVFCEVLQPSGAAGSGPASVLVGGECPLDADADDLRGQPWAVLVEQLPPGLLQQNAFVQERGELACLCLVDGGFESTIVDGFQNAGGVEELVAAGAAELELVLAIVAPAWVAERQVGIARMEAFEFLPEAGGVLFHPVGARACLLTAERTGRVAAGCPLGIVYWLGHAALSVAPANRDYFGTFTSASSAIPTAATCRCRTAVWSEPRSTR